MKMDDIAKLANVSKAAVSLAINNKPGISDETRERIMKIVKESGYFPHTLVNTDQLYGTSRTIRFLACTKSEVVSPSYSSTTFFAELIQGLEKQCREFGFSLIYSSIDGKHIKEEVEILEMEHSTRGTILLGTNLSQLDIEMTSETIPNLVVLDNFYEYMDVNFIVMNNGKGAYNAAMYLIHSGFESFGYVQSFLRVNNFEMRKKGFLSALKENNLRLPEENIYTVGFSIENAQQDFKKILLLNSNSLPKALFCESDYLAIGVIKALQESGKIVPDDISVIGFDNVSQSTIITPELTTIHVEKTKLGALAVQRMDEIINKKETTIVKSIIDTRLVERKSCLKG